MLKVTIDNGSGTLSVLEIDKQKEDWIVADRVFDGDIVQIKENLYHVIWRNRSFSMEIVAADIVGKSFQLIINGLLYTTTAKDQLDLLLDGLGMNNTAVRKLNHVKAPMPGLIQSIAVEEGMVVNKGDNMLVLVAMKMENVIKAPGSGVVKSLKITSGQTVEKNQVLLEFE